MKNLESNKSSILQQVPFYVHQFLLENLPSAYLYHNYDHAEEVAEVCAELADQAELSRSDKEILVLAGWFHDSGYASMASKGNRDVASGSVQLASQFLKESEYPEERIDKVSQLIQSVHKEKAPTNTLERLLCDANGSFMGRKRFERRAKLLRLEKEALRKEKLSAYQWSRDLLDMLIQHRFYSPWAQKRFSSRHNKNIIKQRKGIHQAYKKTIRKRTGKEFGRGVDTLYRVTLRNHINLSRIADGKANMIISVNTLVLSILITAGVAGFSLDQMTLASNLEYIIPVMILMLTALFAIIFAVLSAVPKVSGIDFDEEDIKQHKVSLLFFGNFLKVEKERFVEHLRDLKKNQELLYDDLSRDLYNIGAVLKNKYRLLTIAYRIFIGGLILSFLVFLMYFLI